MNSSFPHSTSAIPPASSDNDNDVDVGRYVEVLLSHKWLILAITLVVLAIGTFYALMERPVYQTEALIQVEDTEGASKGVLGEAAGLFDVRTPTSAEMEIIRSRMVVAPAVEATKLYISSGPRYIPYIGGWLARRANALSDPGFLGMQGYVSGTERIVVSQFDVPTPLEGALFRVTAKGGGQYTLEHPRLAAPLTGTVGTMLNAQTDEGPISLQVDQLAGKPGAEFDLTRFSKLSTVAGVQTELA
ncbi:MAG: tyrosine protein kinase, partial [Comamonadaceae bacterium]